MSYDDLSSGEAKNEYCTKCRMRPADMSERKQAKD